MLLAAEIGTSLSLPLFSTFERSFTGFWLRAFCSLHQSETKQAIEPRLASERCGKMAAFTATPSAVLIISGSRHRRRLAASFSRRSQAIPALATPAPPPPLPLPWHSLGLPNARKWRGRGRGGGVLAEEDMRGIQDLEAQIIEFMEKSENPMNFPTKEDLIAAGRDDLVRAIAKEGGWLAYGWHLDEDEEGPICRVAYSNGEGPFEKDLRISKWNMASVTVEADASLNEDSYNLPDSSEDSSRVSSSGSLMDAEASEDAGIEGILSRLEKERNSAFGLFPLKAKQGGIEKEKSHLWRAGGHDYDDAVGSIESTGRSISSHVGEGSHHHSRALDSNHQPPVDVNMDSDPGMWRAWSIHRSGDPLCNFEAAEIVSEEDQSKSSLNSASYQLIKDRENISEVQKVNAKSNRSNCPYDTDQGGLKNEICIQLQNLESQLTSALFLVSFRTNIVSTYKGQDKESLLKELHKLSDALEFQQNEIKNSRDKLRSTRAKLAVMEGKIALEVIESKNIIEEKQRKLDAAERALLILRPVSIVWPKFASSVLLSGSFDGWTSQRRMEKCNSGVFSLDLRLYPGRYEIKFIVDGSWTVDPLRPIIKNNGFENNLLVVT